MHHTVSAERFSFEVGGERSSAWSYAAESTQGPEATLVLAHGAGAPQTHPWMVAMAKAVAARGIAVVTFNFLYAENRRRAPDRNDVLEATWRAAIEAVRERHSAGKLLIGGKSMGGRIATQVAAQDGVDVDGIVLLGYPLHPPGKPEQLRTRHLPSVRAPMLFVQGSRDPFGGPDELAPFVKGLAAGTRLVAIDGGDHSLALPKGRAVSLATTMTHVAEEIARFIAS